MAAIGATAAAKGALPNSFIVKVKSEIDNPQHTHNKKLLKSMVFSFLFYSHMLGIWRHAHILRFRNEDKCIFLFDF